ncbi:MAG: class I SAM-dependent methyltransferase [Spirochaetes bacterium]|nr:class I SAM-dependent methyltransferase [Spirochaetota bacterium]
MTEQEKDFCDEDFAARYTLRHKKVARRLGLGYATKLTGRGFTKGRILDAGCGFGGMDLVLAERLPECEITGIDISEPLIRRAVSSLQGSAAGGRVGFERGDAKDLRFEEGRFDIVFCIGVLHLTDEPLILLDEMERVLAPDGTLFVADLRRSVARIFERECARAFSFEEAKELIRSSSVRGGRFSKDLLWWRFETE